MSRALLGTITPGQKVPGSNDNEGVLPIPQIAALLKPYHKIV